MSSGRNLQDSARIEALPYNLVCGAGQSLIFGEYSHVCSIPLIDGFIKAHFYILSHIAFICSRMHASHNQQRTLLQPFL